MPLHLMLLQAMGLLVTAGMPKMVCNVSAVVRERNHSVPLLAAHYTGLQLSGELESDRAGFD